MSKDPFFEREAQKYESPIPSREFILDLLEQRKKPATREELEKALKLTTEEEIEGLRRRLRAMERDGQLIFTNRNKCYALPDKMNVLKGTVIGHREGYGFLRVEGEKTDYFISYEQMRSTMHGDVVLAQAIGQDKKGKQEVRIIRVVTPRKAQIVGRYFTEAGVGFVVPDDSRLHFDIIVPDGEVGGARMGHMVVVEIIHRSTRSSKAIGRITEVLGDKMGTSMAVDIALRTHDIPHVWPAQVTKELEGLKETVPEKAKENRVDLRKLPLITIDGEDARDFDDAVYCEKKKGGGWRLWVAIADVSYYVRPGSSLDKEARSRGTSVYFPSQVVPMLPEVLSNGLCSLNPQVDRLCMVAEMTISQQGKLSGYKFYEAVMNSHARMTYTKVAEILDGNEEIRKQYHALIKPIEELNALYKVLDKAREERGGISFETDEPKFIFNAERRIERVEVAVRNDAHKIIEECMILANISAAKFVGKAKEPALYRVHDAPSDERLGNVRSVLAELGITMQGGNKPSPKDYADVMDAVADRPDHAMLQTMLLRSMKQAVYDPDNRGHFGLALETYAHFTSPIRRYPDLTLHRAIKYLVAKNEGNAKNALSTGGYHGSMDEFLLLGEHCSMTERRADEATREVSDWLKCDFMRDHVGETFEGIISAVAPFGFFVRLNDLFIDGLVHVALLDNDYYMYDAVGQKLIGENAGKVYRLGDEVEVRVEAVNMDDRKIEFKLLSSKRTVRNVGKTERDKAKKALKGGDKRSAGKAKNSKKLANDPNFEPNEAFKANSSKGKKVNTTDKKSSNKPTSRSSSKSTVSAKPTKSKKKSSSDSKAKGKTSKK
ncbi:ribonuclease R [Thorsellia kenyensis]|uniref:Ribonuclease R n=1 Tax=Thorsellia kenyensis TaxID=1549888 RepID=A0ABV6CCQ5_9GAMM